MRSIAVVVVAALLAGPVLADWDHPVKWDQLDPQDTFAGASWIDNDTPSDALTADDYLCTDPWWITDIEFYGFSYYGSQYINQFRIAFWSDVPATPNDASHPGDLLWEYYVDPAAPGDPLSIGWKEIEPSHFKIDLPQDHWFQQYGTPDNPIVYWISIQGVMVNDGFFDAFYWNFRERHTPTWGDDAAFTSGYFGYPPWSNWGSPTGYLDPSLYDGPLPEGWTSLDMSFRLTGIPEPASLVLLGLGILALRRR